MVRPYDTSRIMAILSPDNYDDESLDLLSLDFSRETDFFTLKFLLCNAGTESSTS